MVCTSLKKTVILQTKFLTIRISESKFIENISRDFVLHVLKSLECDKLNKKNQSSGLNRGHNIFNSDHQQ